MEQLEALVSSYASGEQSYEAFRTAFVQRFLIYAHPDDLEFDRRIAAIEGLCFDIEMGDISENDMRREIMAR